MNRSLFFFFVKLQKSQSNQKIQEKKIRQLATTQVNELSSNICQLMLKYFGRVNVLKVLKCLADDGSISHRSLIPLKNIRFGFDENP